MNNRREVVNLPLEDILPNRFQPRIRFDEKAIVELSESIKEHGVIQPIIVRGIGDKYEIIAGERRYKASVMAGKTHIPSIIVNLNDKEASEIALIENVQREDLTPIEEAISYRKILDMGYLTQEELAEKLGVAQSTVANKLRLLNLDDEVQDALLEEKISERHARSLLKLPKLSMQREMLKKIIKERLTVRKTDEEIENMMKDKTNSILDSIENTMLNNQNNFNVSNGINNETNINVESPFSINNMSVNPTPEASTSDSHENKLVYGQNENIPSSSDIEIIDFTDSNDNLNIPTMPIVEDIVENNELANNQNNSSTFNSFESMQPNNQDFNVPFPNNIKTNSINTNVNDNVNSSLEKMNSNQNVENSVNQIVDDTTDDDSADEKILKPGRFFNILNYDKDEANEVVENSSNNETLSTLNNTSSEVPLEQNNVFNFNQFLDNGNLASSSIIDDSAVSPQNPVNNSSTTSVTNDYEEPVETNPETITSLRDVINLIRDCAETIEKNNFEIDTEEFDFDDIYQVIFKIKK